MTRGAGLSEIDAYAHSNKELLREPIWNRFARNPEFFTERKWILIRVNSPAIGGLVVREEGVRRNRVAVIPNFVEEEAFAPLSLDRRTALRQRVGLGPTDMAVGVMANLVPGEGPRDAPARRRPPGPQLA